MPVMTFTTILYGPLSQPGLSGPGYSSAMLLVAKLRVSILNFNSMCKQFLLDSTREVVAGAVFF